MFLSGCRHGVSTYAGGGAARHGRYTSAHPRVRATVSLAWAGGTKQKKYIRKRTRRAHATTTKGRFFREKKKKNPGKSKEIGASNQAPCMWSPRTHRLTAREGNVRGDHSWDIFFSHKKKKRKDSKRDANNASGIVKVARLRKRPLRVYPIESPSPFLCRCLVRRANHDCQRQRDGNLLLDIPRPQHAGSAQASRDQTRSR